MPHICDALVVFLVSSFSQNIYQMKHFYLYMRFKETWQGLLPGPLTLDIRKYLKEKIQIVGSLKVLNKTWISIAPDTDESDNSLHCRCWGIPSVSPCVSISPRVYFCIFSQYIDTILMSIYPSHVLYTVTELLPVGEISGEIYCVAWCFIYFGPFTNTGGFFFYLNHKTSISRDLSRVQS